MRAWARARDNCWPALPQDRFSSLSSLPYCCAQNSSCSFNSDGSCSCLDGESFVRQYITCFEYCIYIINCIYIHLYIYIFIYFYLFIYLFIYLFMYLFIYLFMYLFIGLSIY